MPPGPRPVPSFPPPTAAAHHCSFAAVSQFRFGGPASHCHDDFYPCQFSSARLAPICTTALPPLLATSTSPCLIRRGHATPMRFVESALNSELAECAQGIHLAMMGLAGTAAARPESPTLRPPSARNQEQSRSGPTGAPQDAANFPEKKFVIRQNHGRPRSITSDKRGPSSQISLPLLQPL